MIRPAPRRFGRPRDYAPQICLGLGILVGAAVWRRPAALLQEAGAILALWTLLVMILRLRWKVGVAVHLVALAGAISGLFLVGDDRRALARDLIPVFVVASLIALVVFRTQVARRWPGILVSAATVGLIAGGLWLAGPRLVRALVPSYNLDLDHRPKPFDKDLETNEDGIVSARAPSDFSSEDFNIIFLGDSFTQGIRAPYAFPALVESLLTSRFAERRFRVANFGWTSSSPLLQVRQLLDIGAKYKPKLVVQCFDMTDFHDDLKYTHWFRERGIEPVQISVFQIVRTAVSQALGVQDYPAWLESQLRWGATRTWADERDQPRPRYFAVGQPLERTAPLLQTSWDGILATRAVAQSLGAKYVLMVLPRYQQFNPQECPRDWETDWPEWNDYIYEPFEYFRRQAASAPFPVHSLLEAFQTSGVFPVCFEEDPHWNLAGHGIAARAITDFLVQDGVLE